MTDTRYNGWSNYETWNCALWFDNDYGLYSYWGERAQELYDDAEGDTDDATSDLSRELQEWVEENTPETTGIYADLLNAAIGSIDWYEIAEHYMSNIEKRQPESTPDDTLEA